MPQSHEMPLTSMKPASPEQTAKEIHRFLVEFIDSVPELEALLLFRDDAAREWTGADLSQRLYVTPRAAGAIVAKLDRCGWVTRSSQEGRYRYRTDATEAGVIDLVSAAYGKHLSLLARVIHEKPAMRLLEFTKALRAASPEGARVVPMRPRTRTSSKG